MEKVLNSLGLTFKEYGINSGDSIIMCLPEISEKRILRLSCKQQKISLLDIEIDILNHMDLEYHLNQTKAKALVIADWGMVAGEFVPIKTIADRASINAQYLVLIITIRDLNKSVSWLDGRDLWWDSITEVLENEQV